MSFQKVISMEQQERFQSCYWKSIEIKLNKTQSNDIDGNESYAVSIFITVLAHSVHLRFVITNDERELQTFTPIELSLFLYGLVRIQINS